MEFLLDKFHPRTATQFQSGNGFLHVMMELDIHDSEKILPRTDLKRVGFLVFPVKGDIPALIPEKVGLKLGDVFH
jgi:hypothetical protein